MNIEINKKLADRLKAISNNTGLPVNKFITNALEVLAQEAEKIMNKKE